MGQHRRCCRRRRLSAEGAPLLPTGSARSVRALVSVSSEYYRLVIVSLLRAGLEWEVQATAPETLITSMRRNSADLCVVGVTYCMGAAESICARLRRVSSAPILVVGSHADEERALSCLEEGADAYLLWPFDPEHLVALARALRRRANDEFPIHHGQ